MLTTAAACVFAYKAVCVCFVCEYHACMIALQRIRPASLEAPFAEKSIIFLQNTNKSYRWQTRSRDVNDTHSIPIHVNHSANSIQPSILCGRCV